MNDKKRLRCIQAPGLPPSPKLFFDPKSRSAFVRLRHTTWQSHRWGRVLARWLSVFGSIFLAFWLFGTLRTNEIRPARILVPCFGGAVFLGLSRLIAEEGLGSFLARRIFSQKTEFWFTPDRLGFRSSLYGRGVIVFRQWKDRLVASRFVLSQDHEASDFAMQNKDKPTGLGVALQRSTMLEMVISTMNPNSVNELQSQQSLARSIPIAVIDAIEGRRLTVVLSAAASLTSASRQSIQSSHTTTGQDLDSR